jgi:mannitol-1-phosphate 5-dehydrogenase
MSNTGQAIHFGAGNIGRGFIALLLSRSGYEVTFADVQEKVIDEINARGEYPVEIVGRNWSEHIVSPVRALHSDSAELADAFISASIVTTAVGPGILRFIAPAIARGIAARREAGLGDPMNVIACENMIGGSSELAALVRAELSEEDREYAGRFVGFPDAAVDRIIPPGEVFEDILRVRVEEFSEWIVDGGSFVGEIPEIEGMITTDNLSAYLERKLFTLNTGHASAAYLGARRKYRTIGESVADPEVRRLVESAMVESGEVLIRRYGFDPEEHRKYIAKILERFANPALIDEISRVGRQPLRKLSRDERLIKPLRGTLEYGTGNDALIQIIAAALAYRHPDDGQSREMGNLLSQKDLIGVLEKITGLGEEEGERKAVRRIAQAYEDLSMNLLMEEYLRRRTRVVSIPEAAASLQALVDEALSGSEVILAHRGMPMVRLIPIGNYQTGMLQIPGSP